MSNKLEKHFQKRRNKMNQQPGMAIPMSVPNLGQQKGPGIDINEAIWKTCTCENDFFDKVYRVGHVSKMASKNTTGQDVAVEMPVYICHKCGMQIGAEKQT